MVGIGAGAAPDDVHFTGGQIKDQSIDGFLVIKRYFGFNGMVADRIGVIDMVTLDGLQGFDGMFGGAFKQSKGTEITNARVDQVFRLTLDAAHGL